MGISLFYCACSEKPTGQWPQTEADEIQITLRIFFSLWSRGESAGLMAGLVDLKGLLQTLMIL